MLYEIEKHGAAEGNRTAYYGLMGVLAIKVVTGMGMGLSHQSSSPSNDWWLGLTCFQSIVLMLGILLVRFRLIQSV